MKGLFEPKSIAVVGASRSKGKVGHDVLKNLLKSKAKIYAVNPKTKKVLGKQSYTSVIEIPGKVDLAIVVVPAKIVPMILKDCAKKKIKNAIIISAGFSEIGNKKLEEQLVEIAEENNINLLGPNCLGIINPMKKINASFFNKMPEKGNIAFVSQSGALGVAMLDWAIQENIGFSHFISVGNTAQIGFSELINYLAKDKQTKSICIYVESLKDGRQFMNAVSSCKKPIVVLKGGLSEAGQKAAETHTAALASPAEVYKGAFKQCGVIQVKNLHQLFEVAKHFANDKAPKGKKGLIITNAGGAGVLASDAFEKNGLEHVNLPERLILKMNSVLPENWSKSNPIDVVGDATPKRYKKFMSLLEKEKFYDFVFFAVTPQTMTQPDAVAKILVNFHKKTKIPCFGCFMGGDAVKRAKKILKSNNIPNFKEPGHGIEIIGHMVKK